VELVLDGGVDLAELDPEVELSRWLSANERRDRAMRGKD